MMGMTSSIPRHKDSSWTSSVEKRIYRESVSHPVISSHIQSPNYTIPNPLKTSRVQIQHSKMKLSSILTIVMFFGVQAFARNPEHNRRWGWCFEHISVSSVLALGCFVYP